MFSENDSNAKKRETQSLSMKIGQYRVYVLSCHVKYVKF